MKREYIRPYLAVESFQLNAAIAGACGGNGQIALAHSVDECKANDATGDFGGPYYGAACDVNVVLNDGSAEVCYHSLANVGVYLTS